MHKPTASYRMPKSVKTTMLQTLDRHAQGAFKTMMIRAELISTEALARNRPRKTEAEAETE